MIIVFCFFLKVFVKIFSFGISFKKYLSNLQKKPHTTSCIPLFFAYLNVLNVLSTIIIQRFKVESLYFIFILIRKFLKQILVRKMCLMCHLLSKHQHFHLLMKFDESTFFGSQSTCQSYEKKFIQPHVSPWFFFFC